MKSFRFTADLWRYTGEAAWYFVTLPHGVADDVDELVSETLDGPRRGFGSVRVEVRVGASTWRTSLFPDSASQSFVLPVKKAVRVAEDLDDGSPVDVRLTVL